MLVRHTEFLEMTQQHNQITQNTRNNSHKIKTLYVDTPEDLTIRDKKNQHTIQEMTHKTKKTLYVDTPGDLTTRQDKKTTHNTRNDSQNKMRNNTQHESPNDHQEYLHLKSEERRGGGRQKTTY